MVKKFNDFMEKTNNFCFKSGANRPQPKNLNLGIDDFLTTADDDRKKSTFFPKTASLTEASSTVRRRRPNSACSRNQRYEEMLCKILDLKKIKIDATGLPVASTAVDADDTGSSNGQNLQRISEALLTGKMSFFATPLQK